MPTTITDHRGRSHRVQDHRIAEARRGSSSHVPPAARARLLAAAQGDIRSRHLIAGAVFCGLFALVPAAIVPLGMGYRGLSVVVPAIAASVAIGLAYVRSVRKRMTRWQRERILNAAAEAGLCAVCGYLLYGLPREADGCTVCPECGAAWRVDPAVQAIAPEQITTSTGLPPNS